MYTYINEHCLYIMKTNRFAKGQTNSPTEQEACGSFETKYWIPWLCEIIKFKWFPLCVEIEY